MKKPLPIAVTVIIIAAAIYIVYSFVVRTPTQESVNTAAENANVNATEDTETINATDSVTEFPQQVKTPHFEASIPLHEAVLPASPINVVLTTNFDLAAPSTISVQSEGTEFATGETTIDANKLAMRRTMSEDAPDGRYTVTYKACWPDGSCHDGTFTFDIDRTIAESYEDARGEKNVTIALAGLAFDRELLRIERGTTVTWQNNDEVGHYINTDPHPGHAYYPEMNSQELLSGDDFSVTFTTPGYYPYHCSTHPAAMTGVILVE